METSTRRLGNEVSAGNTDVHRMKRKRGQRARLIDTVTEKPRERKRKSREDEGACEGIKENRCTEMGWNQSCWAIAEKMQLYGQNEVACQNRVGASIEHLANVFFHSEN